MLKLNPVLMTMNPALYPEVILTGSAKDIKNCITFLKLHKRVISKGKKMNRVKCSSTITTYRKSLNIKKVLNIKGNFKII